MKVLKTEGATALAGDWGYQVDQDTLLQNELGLSSFPFPAHREGMGYLSREMAKLLGRFDRCLLLITEFGIWPSMEDLNLFNRFRRSFGVSESFPNCLGHVFDKHEIHDSKLPTLDDHIWLGRFHIWKLQRKIGLHYLSLTIAGEQ